MLTYLHNKGDAGIHDEWSHLLLYSSEMIGQVYYAIGQAYSQKDYKEAFSPHRLLHSSTMASR